ncbi:MAG: D-glycero-beta-D-manno-heptose-7-phosphate kinase [Bdellovibrionales bacterium]|nr:D-glycero-beta-D-manno-heptose-7-phosphate kinase [Bdellovibrionales bacterium]
MKGNKDRLLSIVARFPEISLAVVGDLLLDHYIWGKVDRISPEAPVVVVQVTEENRRLGGAGNVAHNIASLGAKASVFGVVGDDDGGRQMTELFRSIGADTSGVVTDATRPTTVKTRVIAHAQQVVRVDYEVTDPLASSYQQQLSDALRSGLARAQGVIVSDYAKGTITPSLFAVLGDASAAGRIGLGKVPVLIDPKAPNFSIYAHASIIKPNRKEAEEATGIRIKTRGDAIQAGRKLLREWNSEMILITLGELGMVLVGGGGDAEQTVEVDTVAREVYDVSGAGDTVSAVFALALAAGATPAEAAMLANFAAGVVVGEVGTVAVTAEELRAAISRGDAAQ